MKFGKGDRIILEKIKEANKETILVINKIDLVKKDSLLKLIEMYNAEYSFKTVIPISATKNENTEIILEEIEKYLPYRTSIL